MDMNILGFYANTKMLEQEEVFRHFFCSLSKERQQKIEAMKAETGRRSSLGAWALLDHGLHQLYGLREREITIAYGAHGKPYVKDRPEIHFNLSHSGDYVLAVFGSVELGCDIQMIGEAHRNDRIAARFFTEAEQKALAEGIDFYRIWARKESYIKCTGNGMACDLRSFDVVGDLVKARETDAIAEVRNIHDPNVTVQYLHSYDAKIHENRLRRWDFRTHEACSSGLHGSAPTCSEQLHTNMYFSDHDLPGYAMAVCYKHHMELPVAWQEVNFDGLL